MQIRSIRHRPLLARRMRRQPSGRMAAACAIILLFAACVAAVSDAQTSGAYETSERAGAWAAGEPSGWVRLRTTAYRFDTDDVQESDVDRLGAYQEYDGAVSQLAGGLFAVRLSGRLADDVYLKKRTTETSRLFVGQIEARPFDRFRARLGRQFVQEGPVGLTLDGIWLQARPIPRWEARAWAGARAASGYRFRAGSTKDDGEWGVRVATTAVRRARLSGTWAYRSRKDKTAAQLAGLEASFAPGFGLNVAVRGAYDFKREQAARADLLVQWQLASRLPAVSCQVINRRAAFDAVSYFARFESEPRQLVRVTASQRLSARGYAVEAEYFGSFVEELDGHRVGGAFIFPYGRAGYSARLGDIGEESRFYGQLSYRPVRWLRLQGGATLLTYALIEDEDDDEEDDDRDLTTFYGRARFEPRPGVGIVLEIQGLTNPGYEHDVRILGGLDLTAGFGATRFGLTEGW